MVNKKVDFIIVGAGLAGLAISRELHSRGKSFITFDNSSQTSSYVAGGIFNPVILKRFTPAWKAKEQMEISIPFYAELEQELQQEFIHHWDIYRRFYSIEEQNDWFVAADKPLLAPFLDQKLVKNSNPSVETDYGFGRVMHTGNIDTEVMLDAYRDQLQKKQQLIAEKFDYDLVKMDSDCIMYRDIHAKHIIFCEGFGVTKNPFFNYFPLHGNKGEYIIIKSPELKLEFAIKASVFIMPMGNDLYKVGATYNNHDKTPEPTSEAREQLEASLKQVVNASYEVVDQVAGIRPTSGDRRPVVGKHPEFDTMYCFNGFGSRGVLIAPYLAPKLADHILEDSTLEKEIDIARFQKRYFKRS
ncbi:NAD(P)/FAD-dependent oxidoreductase [Christiangramia marina]|uniref:NAD(P)/FAD-dependent oxidoreductase n=1 Tax=Christiangramia marina TaxID=409436 RepID=UPI003AA831F9